MRTFFSAFALMLAVLLVMGCESSPSNETDAAQQASDAAGALVVYSGRSKSLVEPLVERFQAATGLTVNVRYGGTAALAVALAEEGARSPADLFWAQDGGALGAIHEDGLFAPLPDSLLGKVPATYRNTAGTWVATSGRARTLAYAPARIDADALPTQIADLTDPVYRGRVGWAPANGSFQAFVTALRQLVGEAQTRAWLTAMRDNGAQSYANNRAILQGIADGEVDLGLPNHYYLLGFKKDNPAFPVEQTFFAEGDPGNLVNVAGIGVLQSSARRQAALRFISYLLSDDAQAYITEDIFEYPVVETVAPAAGLTAPERLEAMKPTLDLESLRSLEATLEMLRDVGLL